MLADPTMRILHLADRLSDRGGAYTWTRAVIDALAADHQVALAVGVDEGSRQPSCPVVVRPGLESRVSTPVALEDLVRGYDVVHLHNVTNPAVLDWASAHGRALLSVQDHRFFCPGRGKWTAAGEVCREPAARERCERCFEDARHFEEVRALTERRLAAARRLTVTVLSRYMRGELVAAGVPAWRVSVVPPFVVALDTAAAACGPPCVLFVGRLVEAKGVRDAVEAWRLSKVPLPLVVAGTGPMRTALERAAATGTTGSPRLEVLGWVERGALAGLYRRARALLFPPRWQEPFGIVGIEALSFGVPVVAWESGGVSEWHPGTGLVRWGDVPALARALREAVERRWPVARRPDFDRDETLGRLLMLYHRLSGRESAAAL